MFDYRKSLVDSSKEKAVDDPSIRTRDPAAWACLTDEQRDIIHTWYYDKEIVSYDEGEKAKHNAFLYTFLYAVPFAVHYGYQHFDGQINLSSIFNAFLAYWCYVLLFHAVALVGENWITTACRRSEKIMKTVSVALVLAFVVYGVLSKIHGY